MTKKENGFEMLARLIKEEGEETRKEVREEFKTELGSELSKLRRKMDEGFAGVNRRLDETIQPQLDDHAHRIKILEERTPAIHS